jgi:hypothetical protein
VRIGLRPASLRLGVALLLAGRPSPAQTAQQECDKAAVAALAADQLGAWASVTPARVLAALKPLTDAWSYAAALDTVAATYLADRPGGAPPTSLAGVTAPERVGLRGAVAAARAELQALATDPQARNAGRVNAARFDLAPSPVGDEVTLFNGEDHAIALAALPRDTRRSVCWFAIAARDLLVMSGGVARGRLLAALEARVARWDGFTRHGYSMLPHELLVNGWLRGLRRDLEPPRAQLVLLHPSAAAQMTSSSLRSLSSLRRVDALAVEPVGVLIYDGTRRRYGGASWVIGFPAGDRASSGVMAHYNPLGRAGYVWTRDDEGRRRGAVVLSMDLYRYLAGVPERWTRLKNASAAECIGQADRCVQAAARR